MTIASVLAVDTIDECPDLQSTSVSDDRYSIKPWQIAAVMAMGDDLVAALAAKTQEQIAIQEFKGVSFASGADNGAFTLHNLFKRYNHRIKGGSHGAHPVPLCPGGLLCHKHDQHSFTSPLQDRLNVALSGATIDSLPVQLQQLRRQARRLNVTSEEWKMLVVHIGAVDVCQVGCTSTDQGDQFESRLRSLLFGINQHLPRTIVSILLLSDSSQLHRFVTKTNKNKCDRDARRIATAQCPCGMATDDHARYALSATIAGLNQRILHLAHQINTDPNLPFIGVHISRPLEDLIYSKHLPSRFVSPLDCIHWTVHGQRALAASVWRGLFGEHGVPKRLTVGQQLYCPTEADTIKLYTDTDSTEEL